MNEKDFLKKEPLYFKICYVLGLVFFSINLQELTSKHSEPRLIFPLLAVFILILLFIRIFKYHNKYN